MKRHPYTLNDVIEQEFVEIDGCPNYILSSFGYVVRKEHEILTNIGHLHTLREIVLVKYFHTTGYWVVDIKGNPTFLHRLLAEHFIPNPFCKETVNHKDGNKWNLALDNLEWATQGENNKHAYDTGLKKKDFLYLKIGDLHHGSKAVNQFDLHGNFIKRYGSVRQASVENGIKFYLYRYIKEGKPHNNFYWKYDL